MWGSRGGWPGCSGGPFSACFRAPFRLLSGPGFGGLSPWFEGKTGPGGASENEQKRHLKGALERGIGGMVRMGCFAAKVVAGPRGYAHGCQAGCWPGRAQKRPVVHWNRRKVAKKLTTSGIIPNESGRLYGLLEKRVKSGIVPKETPCKSRQK